MKAPPRTRECLIAAVVSAGSCFQDKEGLRLLAGQLDGLESSRPEPSQLAVYGYLGDIALRFMFAADGCVDSPARFEDMQRLDLTPERALALATVSFKRMHGAPLPSLVSEGLYTLRGGSPDAYAGYLLDRAFWRSQLTHSPSGVLVALPKRGTLLFCSVENAGAIHAMRSATVKWHQSAGEHALSSCIYRFDAKGWHVHERHSKEQRSADQESPLKPVREGERVSTRETPMAERQWTARRQEEEELDRDLRLSLAAKGQKAVIYSILLNLVLGGMERGSTLPSLLLLALSVAVAVYALIGVVRMCSGLEKTQGQKILLMTVTFVPLINLIALVWLSGQTSGRLRDAGWSVGLLGVRS